MNNSLTSLWKFVYKFVKILIFLGNYLGVEPPSKGSSV